MSSVSSVSESYDDINERYKKEFPRGTPFVVACEKGRVEDVEAMISGARAAGMDVTAMVNEKGKDSNGSSGYTPLMAAAWYEHSTIIEILLLYNADTATTTNNYGNNALHFAAYNNKTSTITVQLLLNNMKLEDINHKNTAGNTPLDRCYLSTSSIKQQLIELIRQKGGKRGRGVLKENELLIQQYERRFPRGTPFVVACEKGSVEDVKTMIEAAIEAGTDVTAMVNKVGKTMSGFTYTPLTAAAYYEHRNVIKILLQYNADTAATTNDYGWNALHYAAGNNKTNTTTVELLLNNMRLEDINNKDIDGYTPLDHCYIHNYSSIKQQLINLIRQKGGKRASELSSGSSSGSSSRNVPEVWVISSDEEISSDSEDEDGYDNNNNNYNPKIKKPKRKSKKRKAGENAEFQENENCPICLQPLMGTKQALKYDDSIYAIQDDNVDEILILNCCGNGVHKRCIEQSLDLKPYRDNYFGPITPKREGCPICTKQVSLRKPKVVKSSNIEVKTVTKIGFRQTLKF